MIDVAETALNPEQLYDLRQRSDFALRAIRSLDIKLRTPLTTWIERDCSMKEVAQTLDLSLATVKTRLYRARKQACMLRGAQGAGSERRLRFRIEALARDPLLSESRNAMSELRLIPEPQIDGEEPGKWRKRVLRPGARAEQLHQFDDEFDWSGRLELSDRALAG